MQIISRRNAINAIACIILVSFATLLHAQEMSQWGRLRKTLDRKYASKYEATPAVTFAAELADGYLALLEKSAGASLQGKDKATLKSHFLDVVREFDALTGEDMLTRRSYSMLTNKLVVHDTMMSAESPKLVAMRLKSFLLDVSETASASKRDVTTEYCAIAKSSNDLKVSRILLVSDEGFYGHLNGAVDSGETIVLQIALKNSGNKDWRSTSAFLISDDPYAEVDQSEVVYSERDESSGETRTFTPGMEILPSTFFTFTVSPLCPDGRELRFQLRVWDSDFGGAQDEYAEAFTLKVNKVGPLVFGDVQIDDDIPGLSDGNADGKIDPLETIEYRLSLRNTGDVSVQDVKTTMTSNVPWIHFLQGYDKIIFRTINSGAEKPVTASFVFEAQEEAEQASPEFGLLLSTSGIARDHRYRWIATYEDRTSVPAKIPDLKNSPSTTKYGWLGITISKPDTATAQELGADPANAVMAVDVYRNSPAEAGGILPGDIILKIDGIEIKNLDLVIKTISDLPLGKKISVSVLRSRIKLNLIVDIGERPDSTALDSSVLFPGLSVCSLRNVEIDKTRIPFNAKGVYVVFVLPKMAGASVGLLAGDIIMAVNDQLVSDTNDFYRAMNDPDKRRINFTVNRGGESLTTLAYLKK